MLAPLAPAQAQAGCAMVAAAGAHAHGADHQPPTGHPAQLCKQLCAVVAILLPPQGAATPVVTARPAPLRVARLIEGERPDPYERPPKGQV